YSTAGTCFPSLTSGPVRPKVLQFILERALYGSANVQHSYYTSDHNNSGQSFDGMRLAGIPHYSFNISASYKIRVPGGIVEPTISDQYSGGQTLYDNVSGGPTNETINAYNLVNLSANYQTVAFNQLIPGVRKTTFTLGLYNLLNRKYESDIYLATGGYDPTEKPSLFAYAGAPLQIFGSVSVKF
ncbi:TonB-dependent receptor, partial [Acidithiobacillus sp. VAN18-4]|nr:TonB-dependent receptor [Acidithiobacillus sp. VAN18-4]